MFEMYIVPGIQASHVWTVSKILYLQNIDFPLIHEEVKKKKKEKTKPEQKLFLLPMVQRDFGFDLGAQIILILWFPAQLRIQCKLELL